MSAPPVPADLRLLDAMQALLGSAESISKGELDPARRAWALTCAQRTLKEAGGMSALPPIVRDRVNVLGRKIRALDAKVSGEIRARASRLRHGASEVRARDGLAQLGRRTDRCG